MNDDQKVYIGCAIGFILGAVLMFALSTNIDAMKEEDLYIKLILSGVISVIMALIGGSVVLAYQVYVN